MLILLDFKAKKLKINLNVPSKTDQKAETKETLESIDEDRKWVYQATIVRIMKSRKVSRVPVPGGCWVG
jgi:cullin 1